MMRALGRVAIALALVFLVGPFVVVIGAGLTAGEVPVFPPRGLSLRWVEAVFAVESFRGPFAVSLLLAFGATAAAMLLGVPVAYALSRYALPGGEALRTLLFSPAIVPAIVVGLALLRHLVVPLGLPVLHALFLAHTALLVPYAVRVVGASLANLRADIEEAAVLLGASRARAFFAIVLPNIRSGILAAFILGFISSFNQVPASLFLTGPGISTLPIQMLAYMEYTYDPSVAALSALIALGSIVVVFAAERALGIFRYV
jgi:putative spermidine/putrescine transport system permease protein